MPAGLFFSSCSCGPLVRLRCFGCLCPCHESDDEYHARVAATKLTCHEHRIVLFPSTAETVAVEPGNNTQGVEVVDEDEDEMNTDGRLSKEVVVNATLRLVDESEHDEPALMILVQEDHHPDERAPTKDAVSFEENSDRAIPIMKETTVLLSNVDRVELVQEGPDEGGGPDIKVWAKQKSGGDSDSDQQKHMAEELLRFRFQDDTPGARDCFASSHARMSPATFVSTLSDVLRWNTERRLELEEKYQWEQASGRLREERERLLQEEMDEMS